LAHLWKFVGEKPIEDVGSASRSDLAVLDDSPAVVDLATSYTTGVVGFHLLQRIKILAGPEAGLLKKRNYGNPCRSCGCVMPHNRDAQFVQSDA
jgi:hypothetical protein